MRRRTVEIKGHEDKADIQRLASHSDVLYIPKRNSSTSDHKLKFDAIPIKEDEEENWKQSQALGLNQVIATNLNDSQKS